MIDIISSDLGKAIALANNSIEYHATPWIKILLIFEQGFSPFLSADISNYLVSHGNSVRYG